MPILQPSSPTPPASVATWPTSQVGFFCVDYDNGSDGHSGFSVGTPDAAAAAPMKTLEALRDRLPKFGAGCKAVILIKPRSGGATYLKKDGVTVDSLILKTVGYEALVARGSHNFANDDDDKVRCGGRVATGTHAAGYNPIPAFPLSLTGATNASPIEITTSVNHGLLTGGVVDVADVGGNTAANGRWVITVTAANKFKLDHSTGNGSYTASTGSVTSRNVFGVQKVDGAAAALPATAGIHHKRIRFLANTTTAALRNIARDIYHNDTDSMILGHDLPADFVDTDVFVIEEPGVAVATIVASPIGNRSRVFGILSIAGIKAVGPPIPAVERSISVSGAGGTLFMSFCEADSATSKGAELTGWDICSLDAVYDDELSVSHKTGTAGRYDTLQLISNINLGPVSHFGIIGDSTITPNINGNSFFAFGSGARIVGGIRFALNGIGAQSDLFDPLVTQGTLVVGNGTDPIAARRLWMDGGGSERILWEGSNGKARGIFWADAGVGDVGIALSGIGCRLVCDDLDGNNTVANQIGLDLQDAQDCSVYVSPQSPNFLAQGNTFRGILFQGGSFQGPTIPWGFIALADIIDHRGNRVFGPTSLSTRRCSLYQFDASDRFTVVRVSGASKTDKAQADTATHATGVIGVCRSFSNSLYILVQTEGPCPIFSDGVPTVGNMAWLSETTAGYVRDTAPAAGGTNQKLRIGYIMDKTVFSGGDVAIVVLDPEHVPVVA